MVRRFRARLAASLILGFSAVGSTATESGLDVACAVAPVAGEPDARLTLLLWATDRSGQPLREAPVARWSADAGVIEAGEAVRWRLPAKPGEVRARAEVRSTEHGSAACEVVAEVFAPLPPGPGPTRGQLAARMSLLRGASEPPGFGLYSYLLFDRAPADDVARERQLRALESYLREIDALETLSDLRPPSQLNLTLVPLLRSVTLPARLVDAAEIRRAAEALLAQYDHARARHLLDALGDAAPRGGVALVARREVAAEGSSHWLVMDLGSVSPTLAADWVRAFCWLGAQQRSWGEASLVRLGLHSRNALAVAAARLGEILVAWPRLLRPATPR